MKSSLRSTKLFFENIFFNDWAETPIHYAGQEFDSDGIPQWINLYYMPRSTGTPGFGSNKSEGYLNVICWATNEADSMELADKVIEFATTKNEPNIYIIKNVTIDDHGWVDANSVFTFVSFYIESYDTEDICA